MYSGKNRRRKGWDIAWVLFSMPFAGIGLFLIYQTYSRVEETWTIKGWNKTKALIQQAELKVHRGTEGGETYKVEARYLYEYEGKPYQGTRVSISSASDNFGSYQKDVYEELAIHQRTGVPFHCFVNPERPEESILYHDLRLGPTLFLLNCGLVFAGFGIGGTLGSIRKFLSARRVAQLKAAHPDEPWLHDLRWQGRRLRSTATREFVGLLILALFFNALSFPVVLFILPDALKRGEYFSLFFILIPAIAMLLMALTVHAFLVWRRHRRTYFDLETSPVWIGGHLSGSIVVHEDLPRDTVANVSVVCWERVSGTCASNPKQSIDRTRWRLDLECAVRQRSTRSGAAVTVIPVDCALPDDQPPVATEWEDDCRVAWRLEARTQVPGVDLQISFDLPVFTRTGRGVPSAGGSSHPKPR